MWLKYRYLSFIYCTTACYIANNERSVLKWDKFEWKVTLDIINYRNSFDTIKYQLSILSWFSMKLYKFTVETPFEFIFYSSTVSCIILDFELERSLCNYNKKYSHNYVISCFCTGGDCEVTRTCIQSICIQIEQMIVKV